MADSGASLALQPSPAGDARASLWLVRSFVASIYAWSAIAKMRGPWLDGTTLAALHAGHFLRGHLVDLVTATVPARVATSISVVVLELGLGPLLLNRKTRVLGLAAAVAMHALYEVSAKPDVMALVVMSLLCAFLPLHA
jgi:hypothetical protein